jgi:hypothetical protein
VDRRNGGARWIDHALWNDRVFPIPTFYPPYAWYALEHSIHNDEGRETFAVGGA